MLVFFQMVSGGFSELRGVSFNTKEKLRNVFSELHFKKCYSKYVTNEI